MKFDSALLPNWMILFFINLAASLNYAVGESVVETNTNSGPVRGHRLKVLDGHVDTYLGIPYAEIPVGDLRFKRPVPKSKWNTTFNATRLPNSCWQVPDTSFNRTWGVEMWNPNTPMSEDCLYLNVWAPFPGSGQGKYAVMVWIFGGGFWSGTSTLQIYDGRLLAKEGDVVVVSMNYRVGPLGFAYMGNNEAPGNAGLLDQQLALKWVHENIEHFGGDASRITIFGESAGSASVSYHLLAPTSWPYFNNAILQSGSAIADWAFHTQDLAKKKTKHLAERMKCNTEASDLSILSCLKSKDAKAIQDEMWYLNTNWFEVPIGPTIDNHFLTDSPANLIKSSMKKGSILAGGVQDEGTFWLLYGFKQQFPLQPTVEMSRDEYLTVLESVSPVGMEFKPLRDGLLFTYEDSQIHTGDFKYKDIIDDVAGDVLFICPTVDFSNAYSQQGNPVYMYHFRHRTEANPWPDWMGVIHGYEIDYVFGQPLNDTLIYTDKEIGLCKRIIKYWSNFAKTGDPNGKDGPIVWPRYQMSPHAEEVLILDKTEKHAKENGLRRQACSFWRDYAPKLHEKDDNGTYDSALCGSESEHDPTSVMCTTNPKPSLSGASKPASSVVAAILFYAIRELVRTGIA